MAKDYVLNIEGKDNLSGTINNVKKEVNSMGTEIGGIRDKFKSVSNSTDPLNKKLRELRKLLEEMSQTGMREKFKSDFDAIANEAQETKQKIQEIQDLINKTKNNKIDVSVGGGGTGKNIANGITNAINAAQGGVTGLLGSLGKLGPYGLAAGAVGTAVAAIGKSALDSRKDVEDLELSFGTMLGSQQKGIEMVQQLRKYGADTVYDTKGVAEAANTMMAYGVQAQDVMPLMRNLGDIANGNTEHLKSLSLAMGQMISCGRVAKGDLNQLANAGLGFADISKAMGISVGEFQDRVSKGQISITDITHAIEVLTSEGGKFYNGAKNGMNGISGASAGLDDALNNAQIALGKFLEPMAVQFLNSMSDAVEYLTNAFDTFEEAVNTDGTTANEILSALNDVFDALWQVISTVVDYTTTLWQVFGDAITQTGLLDDTSSILSDTLKVVANVIKTVTNVITSLVDWFKSAYNNSKLFRTGILALTAPIRTVIGVVKELIGFIKEASDALAKLTGKKTAPPKTNNKQTPNKNTKQDKDNRKITGTYGGGGSNNSTTNNRTNNITNRTHNRTNHTNHTTTKVDITANLKNLDEANAKIQALSTKMQSAFDNGNLKQAFDLSEQIKQIESWEKKFTDLQNEISMMKMPKIDLSNVEIGPIIKASDLLPSDVEMQEGIKHITDIMKKQAEEAADYAKTLADDTMSIFSSLGGEHFNFFSNMITDMQKMDEFMKNSQAQTAAFGKTLSDNQKNAMQAGAGIANLGSALQEMGADGAVAKAGAVLSAIGQIILGFATASAQAASMGPWGWVAFLGAGLAAVATTISTIQGYATGGIIQGGQTHGDQLYARVNAGEMILNGSQQKRLFDLLDGASPRMQPMNGGEVDFHISGSSLKGVLRNYERKTF